MNALIRILANSPLLWEEIEYHLLRGSMVLIFLIFGYAKWFPYDVPLLAPLINHGPLIFWLYPVFGPQGATWFLGVSEWIFGVLLLAGFWDKRAGVLGAIGSVATFLGTVTIIPFLPNGWVEEAGGFPAMTMNIAFLMKDFVLLAVSVYLLKEDVVRLSRSAGIATDPARYAMRKMR